MTQHNCLGKNCRYFEKYEAAGYWKECDRKKEQKRTARQLQRMKREQEAATEAILQNLAELFQSYIDDAGYAMQIVRVDTELTNDTASFMCPNIRLPMETVSRSF